MSEWKSKIRPANIPKDFTLAPDWYLDAKAKGCSEEQLFALVEDFCRQAIRQRGGQEEPDRLLVEMTIDSYEAGQ